MYRPNPNRVSKDNLIISFARANGVSQSPFFGTGVPFPVKARQVAMGMTDGNSATAITREAPEVLAEVINNELTRAAN